MRSVLIKSGNLNANTMGQYYEDTGNNQPMCKLKREISEGINPAAPLTLNLQPPELGDNKSLLLMSLSL